MTSRGALDLQRLNPDTAPCGAIHDCQFRSSIPPSLHLPTCHPHPTLPFLLPSPPYQLLPPTLLPSLSTLYLLCMPVLLLSGCPTHRPGQTPAVEPGGPSRIIGRADRRIASDRPSHTAPDWPGPTARHPSGDLSFSGLFDGACAVGPGGAQAGEVVCWGAIALCQRPGSEWPLSLLSLLSLLAARLSQRYKKR